MADCIAAPDAERELEEVARRIRLLTDTGVPLSSIAVVARQARPCVDLAISALVRYGIPVTARRRIGLREIPVVRAVRALFAAAAERWSRHALVELAEQPYFASELDARLINFAGFRRRVVGLAAWERALRELAAEAEAEERLADPEREGRGAGLPPSSRAREAADGLAAFAARATVLDGTCTLAEWVGWLAAFLADDPWRIRAQADRVPGDRFDVVRIDLAGWRALSEIVTGWRTALDAWGGAEDRLGAAEFAAQLDDLLDGEAYDDLVAAG